ncbi:hypothetical protein QQS21_008663, partial [Conoideocrella luteorostrata]
MDKLHSVTLFLPSNAALSTTAGQPALTDPKLVSDHIVSDFVGYLPDLKDGAVLNTRSGLSLTIRADKCRYYVNGALITQPNIILDSGVAHIIDQ